VRKNLSNVQANASGVQGDPSPRVELSSDQRLSLTGLERARYFGPVFFCGYIAAICLALMVASLFLVTLPDARAVTAAGLFGFCLSGGLGAWILSWQLRELRFVVVPTRSDAPANYRRVAGKATEAGWRLVQEQPGRQLRARTSSVVDSVLNPGEIVVADFQDTEVRVASICDPGVGFSLSGRRRCAHNRALVREWLET
jgi:hypothetical protein